MPGVLSPRFGQTLQFFTFLPRRLLLTNGAKWPHGAANVGTAGVIGGAAYSYRSHKGGFDVQEENVDIFGGYCRAVCVRNRRRDGRRIGSSEEEGDPSV
jgi:hypothetical protein